MQNCQSMKSLVAPESIKAFVVIGFSPLCSFSLIMISSASLSNDSV